MTVKMVCHAKGRTEIVGGVIRIKCRGRKEAEVRGGGENCEKRSFRNYFLDTILHQTDLLLG
jgi:hypothetical protein